MFVGRVGELLIHDFLRSVRDTLGLKSEGMVQGGGGRVYNWGRFKSRENIRHKAMGKGRSLSYRGIDLA